MTLVVTVTNPPKDQPGMVTTRIFSESGGTIGRSPDSTLQLLDAQKYVSKVHVIITGADNRYYLMDVSTNGTAINGDTVNLRKGQQVELKTGDRIKIGPYVLAATVEAMNPAQQANVASAQAPTTAATTTTKETTPQKAPTEKKVAMPLTTEEKRRLEKEQDTVMANALIDEYNVTLGYDSIPQPRTLSLDMQSQVGMIDKLASQYQAKDKEITLKDIDPNFGVDRFIEGSDVAQTNAFLVENMGITLSGVDYQEKENVAYRRKLEKEAEFHQKHPDAPPTQTIDPDAQALIDKIFAEQEKQERAARPLQNPPPRQVTIDYDNVIGKLLDSLGLHSVKLSKPEYERFIVDVGSIVAAAVDSLIILLRDRAVVKNQLSGCATTFEKVENNPIKLSATVTEALTKMLVDKSDSYMDIKESFKESFKDLRKHQTAIVAAARRTYDVLVKRFHPEYIDLRLKTVAKPGIVKKLSRGRWGRKEYVKYHNKIENDLQIIFDEAFRDAYSEIVKD